MQMFASQRATARAEHHHSAGVHAWHWTLLEAKGREGGWESATWVSTPGTML